MKRFLFALLFFFSAALASDTTGPVIIDINPQAPGAGNTGELRFKELKANGTTYVGLKAPDSISSSVIWTLPTADGSNGQILTTNGSKVLSWTSAAAGTPNFSAVTSGTNTNALVIGTGGTFGPTDATHGTVTANAYLGSLPAVNGGTGSTTNPTATQIPIGDGANNYQPQTMSGDATIAANGALTIANLAITNAKIAAATIDLTAKVTGILPGANGGTGNGFVQIAGPASSLKTYTGPNASCNLLTDNALITVAQGGTGLSSGTSGGIPYYSSATGIASSALLQQYALVSGGGSGGAPVTIGTLGSTTTVLHGNAAGLPTFGSIVNADIANTTIDLTAKVTGILPIANGGTNNNAALTNNQLFYSTGGKHAELGAMTDGQIVVGKTSNAPQIVTAGGDISTISNAGVFTIANLAITNAKIANTTIDLTAKVTGILPGANGGTNNGFVQIAGPASTLKTYTGPNASCNLLTDAAAVTVAQGGTGITSGSSGGVPYFSAAGTIASSATLAQYALVTGGGSGATPVSLGSIGTATTLLHGNAGGLPTWSGVSMTADVTGTLPVANGGTGIATVTTSTYGLICGGTTATGAFQVVAPGTSGYFLQSNGASALPSWVAVSPGSVSGTLPIIVTGTAVALGAAQGPVTADSNSSVGVGAANSGKKVEIWQTAANNTQPAIEVQKSDGTVQWQIDNTITSNVDVKEMLSTSKAGKIQRQSITETVTIANTATSTSATNLIPANASNIIVTYRVTAAITCTSTFSVGDAVSSTRFGTGISKALSTISSSLKCSPPTAPFGSTTATTITITPDTTPTDSTGRLEITVWYDTVTEPGS